MSTRRSWTDDALRVAVRDSKSVASVLRALGLQATGANYKSIHTHVRRLSLDTAHWTGQGHLRGRSCTWNTRRSLDEILVRDSTYSKNQTIKKRLIAAGIFSEVCAECGGGPEWNGKKLVLQLDHKNGVNDDNRIENLRLLCPNCHSQTPTFAALNIASRRRDSV